MRAQFSRVHWIRVVLTGVLVFILVVILNTVLPAIGFVWHTTDRQLFYQVVSWMTSALALLLTFGAALWVARQVERAAPLHGFLLGLLAALLLFILNPDVTNFFQGAYRGRLELLVRALLTFVLMVAAGWLGGVLGSRGREKS